MQKHCLAGTLAGWTEATFMHPIDTLKTKTHINLPLTRFGLYKGYVPVCMGLMPKVAIQFTGLAYFESLFEQVADPRIVPALAGVCTGVVQALTVLTPMEVIKVQQQTNRDLLGVRQVVQRILQKDGVVGLYRGVVATMCRQSWGLVVKFTGYKAVLHTLDDWRDVKDKTPVLHHTIAGGCTNVLVGVLNSPPDVVKTHMQTTRGMHKNEIACLRYLVRNDGFGVFFRGSWLRVLRIAPGGAIQFGTYGYIMEHLNACQ